MIPCSGSYNGGKGFNRKTGEENWRPIKVYNRRALNPMPSSARLGLRTGPRLGESKSRPIVEFGLWPMMRRCLRSAVPVVRPSLASDDLNLYKT
jgi:hypothetical protein